MLGASPNCTVCHTNQYILRSHTLSTITADMLEAWANHIKEKHSKMETPKKVESIPLTPHQRGLFTPIKIPMPWKKKEKK